MGFVYRKKIGLAAVLLAIVCLLAACGAAPAAAPAATEAAQAPTPAPSPAEETSATPAVRAYTDALGRTVQLPARPQRIVAHYYASEMAALGITMAGTNYINAKLVLSEEQLKGVLDVGGEGMGPNIERVLSLNPDLIIVPDFLEAADLEALSKVAPTVAIKYSADVFTRLRTLGDIVGKPEQAEQWIKAYQAKAEAKRSELKSVIDEGETASAFILYVDNQLYIYGPQRLGPTLYDAFGFAPPPKAKELFAGKDALWEQISLETLADYAGDRIFLVAGDDSDDAKKAVQDMIAGPVWKSLPAVKNGKAYIVGDRWGLNDPLTLDWLLDEAAKVLKSGS